MKRLTRHLNEANETYFEHFRRAMMFSAKMFIGALACTIHAILPFVFEKTGSTTITELHDRMVVNRFSEKDADNSRTDGLRYASDSTGS